MSKLRVFLISGSPRRIYNCPNTNSKARTLMLRMASHLSKDFEVDMLDLANVKGRAKIQSCNGCVSASMALCSWPCNCYKENDTNEPDLMWDMHIYKRLDLADAWAVIGPVHWYGPTSNIKLMFDRLVCASGGNPKPELTNGKDVDKAIELEKKVEWKELRKNHLEGRTCGVFCYGDGGADDENEDGIPKILKHKDYFNPKKSPKDDKDLYAGIVWQLRYSGIEVPDTLWDYIEFGEGRTYSKNQPEDIAKYDPEVYEKFDKWAERFADFVSKKGKVIPSKYTLRDK